MEIFAPDYYEKFKCIADKCHHSCCVDWEIYIDGDTYEKYTALKHPIREELLKSIENSADGMRFCSTEDGRCPMLAENGLCRLITAVGEEYLSDICSLHPRFISDGCRRREIGLGLACEEAARLALLCDGYPRLVKIGECEDNPENRGYDALGVRDEVVSILSSDEHLSDKVRAIEEKYNVTASIKSDSEWLDFLSSLEILDAEWLDILSRARSSLPQNSYFPLSEEHSAVVAKFMIYLATRHIFTAENEREARSAVGYALLGGRVLLILISSLGASTSDAVELARFYSSEIEYSESNTEEILFEFQIDF